MKGILARLRDLGRQKLKRKKFPKTILVLVVFFAFQQTFFFSISNRRAQEIERGELSVRTPDLSQMLQHELDASTETIHSLEMKINSLKQQLATARQGRRFELQEKIISRVRVGLVIPFMRCQVESTLIKTLKLWETFPPCHQPLDNKLGDLSLFFSYNKCLDKEPDLMETILRIWNGLSASVRDCFNTVRSISAELSDAEAVDPMGPCLQFHNNFDFLRNLGYDHWLQFELDVSPVQIGWGDRLLELAANNAGCRNWWQLGSERIHQTRDDHLVRGLSAKEREASGAMHFDKNALFCLVSRDFADYMGRIRLRFFPRGCGAFHDQGRFSGPDDFMYMFGSLPENREYMATKISKFRAGEYMMNFGDAKYDATKIIEANPNLMLVRGKYFFANPSEQAILKRNHVPIEEVVQRAYGIELGRQPSRSEYEFVTRALVGVARDEVATRCVLRSILQSCDVFYSTFPSRREDGDDLSCSKYQFRKAFPFNSKGEAAVTGLYMFYAGHMPGHEAKTWIADLDAGEHTCESLAERICRRHQSSSFLTNLFFTFLGRSKHMKRSLYLNCPRWVLPRLLPDTCMHVVHDAVSDRLTAECRNKKGQYQKTSLSGSCASAQNVDGVLKCGYEQRLKMRASGLEIDDVSKRGRWSSTRTFPLAKELKYAFPATNSSRTPIVHDFSRFHRLKGWNRDSRERNLVFWSTDLHAAPSACNKAVFEAIGANIFAKIAFENCKHFVDSSGKSVCADERGLKVLKNSKMEGFGIGKCPNVLRDEFYHTYADDSEMNAVDIVLCSHPASNCELYMPLNKSLIVYATTRLEFGRFDALVDWRKPYLTRKSGVRWKEWLRNIGKIADKAGNVIAANNMYDVKYIEYMTGIRALYIPSWCGGDMQDLMLPHAYSPARVEVLLTPYRTNLEFAPKGIPLADWPDKTNKKLMYSSDLDHPLFDELWSTLRAASNAHFVVTTMKGAFPQGYRDSRDLTQYPAAIFIPYQTSTIFFFELYRQSVPILAPSKSLLLKWIKKHRILWERAYGNPPRQKYLPRYHLPNPNSFKLMDIEKWLDFYDIYQEDTFPHLLRFDSWAHCLDLLKTTDLAKVSHLMRQHNIEEFYRISRMWTDIISQRRNDRAHKSSHKFESADAANAAIYGIKPLYSDELKSCSKLKLERAKLRNVNSMYSCETGEKRRPAVPLNQVLHGTYTKVCKDAQYDGHQDILRCKLGKHEIHLDHPFRCPLDVSVNRQRQLSCQS